VVFELIGIAVVQRGMWWAAGKKTERFQIMLGGPFGQTNSGILFVVLYMNPVRLLKMKVTR